MEVHSSPADFRQLIALLLSQACPRLMQACFGGAKIGAVFEAGLDQMIELRIAERLPPRCRRRHRGRYALLRSALERRRLKRFSGHRRRAMEVRSERAARNEQCWCDKR